MNNAVYGKTMENVRNRIAVKLVSNKKGYLKWTSNPNYMSNKMFENDLVGIGKSKLTLALSKPAHIGMCILELGKVLMYGFYYDYIKNKYGNNSRLLMYETRTEENEDFNSDKEMLDLSNYSTKSKYYDNSNKLVVGKMKDETAGMVI